MVETQYDSMKGFWCSKEGPFGVGVGEKFFLGLLEMRWEMGLRSGFGMMCGVGTNP